MLALLISLVVTAAAAVATWAAMSGHHLAVQRMRTVAERWKPHEEPREVQRRRPRPPEWPMRAVERLQLLTSKEAVAARALMTQAGIRSKTTLGAFLFVRVGAPLMFVLLVLLNAYVLPVVPVADHWTPLAAALGAGAGFYGPTVYLKNRIAKRRVALMRSVPDGLDLIVICVEAGSSLNETFARVAGELRLAHPELAGELAMTSAELAFLPSRRQAFDNLVARTDLEAIRSVVTTLLQAEKFGTPIAQALRVLSAEFRSRRMMAAEEKAARLPVLLTMPMMVFILPVLFIVLLGPAVLKTMAVMGAM
jgi:tight adherence protein C